MEQGNTPLLSQNRVPPCLEVCIDDVGGLAGALAGKADRVEVCSALELGGLTPSIGLVEHAVVSGIPAMILIRPRAGGFIYSADDVSAMLKDIANSRERGAKGVVVGAAKEDGQLDMEALKRMREAAGDLEVCLHRVFDLVPDPFEAMEQLIGVGFARILTSGQRTKLSDGLGILKKLTAYGKNRISIMPGGGVQLENIQALVQYAGVHEIHSSCSLVQIEESSVLRQFGFASPIKRKTISVQKVIAMREALYTHHKVALDANIPSTNLLIDAPDHSIGDVPLHKGTA